MPRKPALVAARLATGVVLLAGGIAGCSQPGAILSKAQAAKMTTGTSDISTACGYALMGSAFPHQHPRLAHLESEARQGAVQLADVYHQKPNDIYLGQSIGSIVKSSLALLSQCGLHQARAPLRSALSPHRR